MLNVSIVKLLIYNHEKLITLKEETFAGRNFCDFAVFGRIRKSKFPRNVTKVFNRKSLFPQKVWNLLTSKVYYGKKFEIYYPQKFIPAKKIDFFITLLATHGVFFFVFQL